MHILVPELGAEIDNGGVNKGTPKERVPDDSDSDLHTRGVRGKNGHGEGRVEVGPFRDHNDWDMRKDH